MSVCYRPKNWAPSARMLAAFADRRTPNYRVEDTMHFMSIYTFHAEHKNAAVARFKDTGGAPPAGIKMLARWHDVGGRRGYTICEADDPVAISIWSNKWSDLMKIEVFPVVSDEQLVKVLSS